jgi:hypothetical protein
MFKLEKKLKGYSGIANTAQKVCKKEEKRKARYGFFLCRVAMPII